MNTMLQSISGLINGTPPPQLSGQMLDTFCYTSIKDRHPVTITKIIDQIFKLGVKDEKYSEDAKEVTAKLSRLKNRLQTDKELEELKGNGEDIEIWNQAIKELKPNTWFSAPWLFIECYMYRYLHQAFQSTATLTYPSFDVFREEKCQGLLDSLDNIREIASLLLQLANPTPRDIEMFIKLSLWGNKTDLSLLKHFNLDLSDVQSASVDKDNDRILSNDLDKVIKHLTSLDGGKVDIVLDNSGYELFGDLCLAEVLLRSPHVSHVSLHMKSLPWFVSDVTEGDLQFMLDTLSGSSDECLSKLGCRWKERFSEGTLTATHHHFWTTHAGFSQMEKLCPDLHNSLKSSHLIFCKGDLNYRKLVNDRVWPHDTPFSGALEGFKPAPLCALRTIKSDSIVGCGTGVVEGLIKGDREQMFCGTYALISSNL